MRRERRLYPRYSVTCELTGTTLSPAQLAADEPPSATRQLRGAVPNIGAGGLCLLTDTVADMSQPLRCQIIVPQLPIGIPTLVQVRWVQAESDGRTYRLGMQFLV